MRRGNLWPQALGEAEKVLEAVVPTEDVALFTFDQSLETLVGFEKKRTGHDAKVKVAAIKSRLAQIAPSWAATNLGSALVAVSDSMGVLNDLQQSDAALQIVLITDLQRGSRLDALQAYEWPSAVQLAVRTVALPSPTNAGLQLLADDNDLEAGKTQRIRIANEPDSSHEQFALHWLGGNEGTEAEVFNAYVPPGETRVVRFPRPEANPEANRLVLSGDDCDFDNTLYIAPNRQQESAVVYLGDDDAQDPQGLAYYLDRALVDSRRRKVTLLSPTSAEQPSLLDRDSTRLVVVSNSLEGDQVIPLRGYLKNGGTLLLVLKDMEAATSLGRLMPQEDITVDEAVGDYVMLGEIDFSHPLFSRFADPRYNDFTKIRFQKHRRIRLAQDSPIQVLSRFDNGDPALLELRTGTGRLFVLASGWHPTDSRLALSTKFVPLIEGLLEREGRMEMESGDFRVNDPVPLPSHDAASVSGEVQKPDGTTVVLTSGSQAFDTTDEPGFYRGRCGDASFDFCVNIAASESKTAPFAVEELERHGIRLGNQPTRAEEIERLRQLHDVELEDQQKVWRTAIMAAVCLLIIETWLAGRTGHGVPMLQER